MSTGYAVLASDTVVLEAGDFNGELIVLAYLEMGETFWLRGVWVTARELAVRAVGEC